MKRGLMIAIVYCALTGCGSKGVTVTDSVHDTSRHMSVEDTTKYSKQVTDEAADYRDAVAAYIRAYYKGRMPKPDTLFLVRNKRLPNIDIPLKIEGVYTLLADAKEVAGKVQHQKRLEYLNVIGWPGKEHSEFLIVAFLNNSPQHNCSIALMHTSGGSVIESLEMQYVYGKQRTSH